MAVQRARSANEFGEWVSQARFEVEALRECMLYGQREEGGDDLLPSYLDPLEAGIVRLFQSMVDGVYQFGREDLDFLVIAERNADEIPFLLLLRQINETHRHGLDLAEEP